MSLIKNDGDSLDCGHYVSDFFMPTHEFGGTVMMTISLKLVIIQKGFILERVKIKQKRDVKMNRCNICGLYHKNPSDKIQL